MDPETEEILIRTRQRRVKIDEELAKMSPGHGSDRKRKQQEDATHLVSPRSKQPDAKRPSLEGQQKNTENEVEKNSRVHEQEIVVTQRRSIYPLDELEIMAKKAVKADAEESENVPPKNQNSGVSPGPQETSDKSASTTPNAVRSPLRTDDPQCAKPENRRAARFAKLAAEVIEFECQLTKVPVANAEKKTGSGYAAKKKSEDKIHCLSKAEKTITADRTQLQIAAVVESSDEKAQPTVIAVQQSGPQLPEDFGSLKDWVRRKPPTDEKTEPEKEEEQLQPQMQENEEKAANGNNSHQKQPQPTALEAFGPLKDWVRPKISPTKSNVVDLAEKLELKNLTGRMNPKPELASVAERRGMWETKIKETTTAPKSAKSVESPGKSVAMRSEAVARVVQSGIHPIAASHAVSPVNNVRTTTGSGVRTTTQKPQSGSPSGRRGIDERSRDVQVMRKRWENASRHGVTVDRNKSIMSTDQPEITDAALRLFQSAPKQPQPQPAPHPAAPKQSQPQYLQVPQKVVAKKNDEKYEEKIANSEQMKEKYFSKSDLYPTAASMALKDAESKKDPSESYESSVVESEPPSSAENSSVGIESELEECIQDAIKVSHQTEKRMMTPIIVETPATPILTVSEYRSAQKQQHSKANTPHKAVIVATPILETTPKNSQDQERAARRDRDRLGTRMAYLNQKINVQQNQIAQISKMMNLLNNEEFQGSSEEVEAERRLLIASAIRTCCLKEVERLGQLMQMPGWTSDGRSTGQLSISSISVPLARDFVNQMINENQPFVFYFVCLVMWRDEVVCTEYVCSDDCCKRSRLEFTNLIQLKNLPPDFQITLDVYGLQAKREKFSHNEKFHINTLPRKDKWAFGNWFNPPPISYGGPSAVRSSKFQLLGSMLLDLTSVNRNKSILNGVPLNAPIEPSVHMRIHCAAEPLVIEHRGFLSVLDNVQGIDAWHLRWGELDGRYLRFFRYPDDVAAGNEPVMSVDLSTCIDEKIRPLSKDLCTRAHSFQLNLAAGNGSTTKLLLSADEKKNEFVVWLEKLNDVIAFAHIWDPKRQADKLKLQQYLQGLSGGVM